jgi:hypothetical protein
MRAVLKERDTELVLRQVIREWSAFEVSTNRNLRRSFKKIDKTFVQFDRSALSAIYSSGYLNEAQVYAVSAFLKTNKISNLNESNFRRVDSKISLIKENNKELIVESWLGDMWNSAKKKASELGTTVKDALTGGWDSIKKIWGNFKELIVEMKEIIMGFIRNLYDYSKKKIVETIKTIKQEASESIKKKIEEVSKPDELHNETSKLKTMSDFFHEKGLKFFSKTLDKAVDGNVNPSVKESKLSRNKLLKDAKILKAISELSHTINESGEADHIQSALIKDPHLKMIWEWFLHAVGFVLSPLTKLAHFGSKYATKLALENTSKFSAWMNGPGPFVFDVYPVIFSEVAEILGTLFHFDDWVLSLIPGVAIIKAYKKILHLHHNIVNYLHKVFMLFAIGTILHNVIKQYDIASNPEAYSHGDPKELEASFNKAVSNYKKKYPNRNAPDFKDLDHDQINDFIKRFKS